MSRLNMSRNKQVDWSQKCTVCLWQIMLMFVVFFPMSGCRTVLVAPPPPPPSQTQHYTPAYEYFYYPDQHVYYDINDDIYFYTTNNRWYRVEQLPVVINLSGATYVPLTLETHQPYKYHKNHRKQYPPRKKHRNKKRLKHHYRYYPDSQVYYDNNRHIYFYKDHNGWQQHSRLPRHIYLDSSSYEPLTMESDAPYKQHSKHKRQFPAPKKNIHQREHHPEPTRQEKQYRDSDKHSVQEGQSVDRTPQRHEETARQEYQEKHNRQGEITNPEARKKHKAKKSFRFQYYPDAQVYYDIDRKIYFFKKGKSWRKKKKLPKGINLNNGRYFSITSTTGKPHKQHQKYRKQYPPVKD